MIKRILLGIASVLILVSCSGGADEKAGSRTTIVFAEGSVTENTLTFDVTVNDAVAASYMCVPESSSTPSAENVLQKGNPVKVGEKVTLTEYNLSPSTTYTIVVAAIDDADNVVSSTLAMTTAEKATSVTLTAKSTTNDTFVFVLTPTNAESVHYKVYSSGETATDADIIATGISVSNTEPSEITLSPQRGSYFIAAVAKKGDTIVRVKDLTFTISGQEIVPVVVKKVQAKNYTSDIMYDIYLDDAEINVIKVDCYFHEGSTSPFAEYVYSKTDDYGVVSHSYSYTSFKDGSRKFFNGGTVKVEEAADSKYSITVKMTRDDNKAYEFTWTGIVEWK